MICPVTRHWAWGCEWNPVSSTAIGLRECFQLSFSLSARSPTYRTLLCLCMPSEVQSSFPSLHFLSVQVRLSLSLSPLRAAPAAPAATVTPTIVLSDARWRTLPDQVPSSVPWSHLRSPPVNSSATAATPFCSAVT